MRATPLLFLLLAATPCLADGPAPSEPPPPRESPPPPAPPPPAEEGRKTLSLGIRAALWAAQLDGSVRVPRGNLFGTEVDFRGDLYLQDTVAVPCGEVFFTSAYFSAFVDAFSFREDTNVILDTTFTFAGSTFNASEPVEVKARLDSVGARLHVTPIAFDFIEFGIVLGARYFRIEGTIRRQSASPLPLAGAPTEASDTFEAPIPFVGLSLRVFIKFIELYAYAAAMDFEFTAQGSRYDTQYLEGEAGAAINIGDHFALFAGYRLMSLKVAQAEQDDASNTRRRRSEYQVDLGGPIVGVRLRF